jgi:hypothetical protein
MVIDERGLETFEFAGPSKDFAIVRRARQEVALFKDLIAFLVGVSAEPVDFHSLRWRIRETGELAPTTHVVEHRVSCIVRCCHRLVHHDELFAAVNRHRLEGWNLWPRRVLPAECSEHEQCQPSERQQPRTMQEVREWSPLFPPSIGTENELRLRSYASPNIRARIKTFNLEEQRVAARVSWVHVSVMAYTFACLGVRQIAQSGSPLQTGNER